MNFDFFGSSEQVSVTSSSSNVNVVPQGGDENVITGDLGVVNTVSGSGTSQVQEQVVNAPDIGSSVVVNTPVITSQVDTATVESGPDTFVLESDSEDEGDFGDPVAEFFSGLLSSKVEVRDVLGASKAELAAVVGGLMAPWSPHNEVVQLFQSQLEVYKQGWSSWPLCQGDVAQWGPPRWEELSPTKLFPPGCIFFPPLGPPKAGGAYGSKVQLLKWFKGKLFGVQVTMGLVAGVGDQKSELSSGAIAIPCSLLIDGPWSTSLTDNPSPASTYLLPIAYRRPLQGVIHSELAPTRPSSSSLEPQGEFDSLSAISLGSFTQPPNMASSDKWDKMAEGVSLLAQTQGGLALLPVSVVNPL